MPWQKTPRRRGPTIAFLGLLKGIMGLGFRVLGFRVLGFSRV